MSISKGSLERKHAALREALHQQENRAIMCVALLSAAQFIQKKFPSSSLVGADGKPEPDPITGAIQYFSICIQQAEQRKAAIIEQIKSLG